MNPRSWWLALGTAACLTACRTGDTNSTPDAAPDAAVLAARERRAADLADASGRLAAMKADFAAGYAKGRTDSKDALDRLDTKATALKGKAATLTGDRKKKADAAIVVYDERRAAAAAAIDSLPTSEPDAATAESSINALVPLFGATKAAYDALAKIVEGP